MPKKQARNPFWFFMAEWKMLQEKKGQTFPNGYRDVQADPDCNAAWRAMTTAQKAPYTAKAKKAKSQPSMGKQTGTGESIQLIKQEEQERQDFTLNMNAEIKLAVSRAKSYNAIPSLTFPFIHMNSYYMRIPDDGPVDYCPAEFAIGEFSIENGISRYYHEIIKTDLHLGYTREAMETSEKTHKLHWNLPIGEGDWAIIYHEMMNFLEPLKVNGQLPSIYSSKKCIHVIPSLLRRMTSAVGRTPEMFTVYVLEDLFGNMLRAVTDHPESNVIAVLAETQLSKELFAHTPNIECDYHKTQEGSSQYCSLSIIRQWAFEFCDQCCRPLGVDMIPGVHCPDTVEATTLGNRNRTLNSSMQSLISDRSVSVLSATGVSQQHRISVSERSRRDEEDRRRGGMGKIEIIDHSLMTDEEHPPQPKPEPPSTVPVPVAPTASTSNLHAPATASQALIGLSRVAPIFNCENFPAIGGRGVAIRRTETRRTETRRPEGPIWSHRGRTNSDSD